MHKNNKIMKNTVFVVDCLMSLIYGIMEPGFKPYMSDYRF